MGEQFLTHRLAWELTFGDLARGQSLRHKCGNRACVNPDHLLLVGRPLTAAEEAVKGKNVNCEVCGNTFYAKAAHLRKGNGRFCSSKCWGLTLRVPAIDRFWESVDKTDGCWIWKKPTTTGYGSISINGKPFLAHRFSWELHHGVVPDGLFVLHKCDHPPCVRPDHLFLGTPLDNMRDMREKGRNKTLRGEQNGNATLNESVVRWIRSTYASKTMTCRQMALELGIPAITVWHVVYRHSWRHVI